MLEKHGDPIPRSLPLTLIDPHIGVQFTMTSGINAPLRVFRDVAPTKKVCVVVSGDDAAVLKVGEERFAALGLVDRWEAERVLRDGVTRNSEVVRGFLRMASGNFGRRVGVVAVTCCSRSDCCNNRFLFGLSSCLLQWKLRIHPFTRTIRRPGILSNGLWISVNQ
jgi:hypothetical protein